jgi:hypothetical protein
MFELLGQDENDMTGSLGWALSQAPSFLALFVSEIGLPPTGVRDAEVRLQEYESGRGFTDIEIELPGKFCVIIEAKRDWNLPARGQLMRYARRSQFRRYPFARKRLVVVSDCTDEYAAARLGNQRFLGVPATPLGWSRVISIAKRSLRQAAHEEKGLIRQLLSYLTGLVGGQTKRIIDSNRVFVVSLGKGTGRGYKIPWIDFVEKKRRYFHPVGGKGGWPSSPPTYIAFRYKGKLQSIHYIKHYEVLTNLSARIPGVPRGEHDPCFLYTLGPAFRPLNEVPVGERIHWAALRWCALDTLFTSRTISDAWETSRKRGESL